MPFKCLDKYGGHGKIAPDMYRPFMFDRARSQQPASYGEDWELAPWMKVA